MHGSVTEAAMAVDLSQHPSRKLCRAGFAALAFALSAGCSQLAPRAIPDNGTAVSVPAPSDAGAAPGDATAVFLDESFGAD
jgi:hypothetical protein